MAKTVVDISMSVDGFIAGPNAGPDRPLGEGGDTLHEWVYQLEGWRKVHGLEGGKTGKDSDVVEEASSNTGAVVMGRRLFGELDAPFVEMEATRVIASPQVTHLRFRIGYG